jgi:arylsulfatase A-like enzyme
VELIDLAATFVDLATVPVPSAWDARSLMPVLRGESAQHRDATVSALGGWKMTYDGRYKYVETDGEPSALYDLGSDPEERHNLVGKAPEVQEGLARRLRVSLTGGRHRT